MSSRIVCCYTKCRERIIVIRDKWQQALFFFQFGLGFLFIYLFFFWLLFNSQASFSSFNVFLPDSFLIASRKRFFLLLLEEILRGNSWVYESWHLWHCKTHYQQNLILDKNKLPGERLQSLCSLPRKSTVFISKRVRQGKYLMQGIFF